ncbi:F0F1 ATP synthase subunit delta [Shimazuella kribbensis]|uniref:F0F1 ATP synthase subunit delta n=1 Tax=Shimazuella kribbensis TaxID=139808 RepID=UPI0004260B6E|nr:F0F1 ATP synthase subunit delta [Shimazuella kribbensis]
MSNSLVAKRYGRALFEVAQGHSLLQEVEADLKLVLESLTSSDIAKWLSHPATSAERKKAILENSFATVSAMTKNFLFLLVDEGRENELAGIVAEYRKLALEASNMAEAIVTTAYSMTTSEKAELITTFSKIIGKKLVIEEQVDSDILGGVIVQVGDRLYDGSLKTKLLRFQERLNA